MTHPGTRLLALCLWVASASQAVTISDITAQVSENSYSNWLHHLYSADGNARGFADTGKPCQPPD